MSKSAYDEVQVKLAQEQGKVSNLTSQVEAAKAEVSGVKSTLAQEQGKVSNLTSQVEAAKAEVSGVKSALAQEQDKVSNLTAQLEIAKVELSELKSPAKPNLRLVRTTSEITPDGIYTEKDSFARGDTLIVVYSAGIPAHQQKYRYNALLDIRNQKTGNIVRLQSARWEGEVAPGASSTSRTGWWSINISGWEAGQYVAAVRLEDDFTQGRSETAATTFTIR